MTTPAVVEVDPHAPQVLSPIKDYTLGAGDAYDDDRGDRVRRNRKQPVEINNPNDLRSKYEEARKRMEQMREESANNRRMLLEMSSVINALKDISIEYDHDASAVATPIVNVQKKIQAIDAQLRSAMLHCDNLEQEKVVQSSTIRAQQGHIKTMEEKLAMLQKQLTKALAEKRKRIASEKETLIKMNKNGEMLCTVQAQEAKIAALEEQVQKFSTNKNSSLHRQIEALNGSHQAKYLEIQAMEKKLAILRDAQQGLALDKDRKLTKHVTFVPDTFSRLDRKKSRSSDQGSQCSSSCGTGQSSSLTSISEEEHLGLTNEDDDGIFSDDRGSSFSSRSFSTEDSSITKDGDPSHSIKITTSYDESVEIVVGSKGHNIDVSDVSYSTEETAETPTVNIEEELNKAKLLIRELQGENKKLRKSHSQALSNMAQISQFTSQVEKTKKEWEQLKKLVEEQRQEATLANTKYEKLRREHGKAINALKDERARYAQLMEDYSKLSYHQSEMEDYEKLKQLHDTLVMKVGDMAEENETMIVQLSESRKARDEAESNARILASEVDSANKAYKELEIEKDAIVVKASQVSQQCDIFKSKYYELLAGDESVHSESTSSKDERYELLRCEYESVKDELRGMESKVLASEKHMRDYSEALAKVQVLEQCNKELEEVREKFHSAQAQVSLLKRANADASKAAKAAKKRDEKRSLYLKDMLSHYKVLENEHADVCQKLKRLKTVVSNKKYNDKEDSIQLASVGSGPGMGASADESQVQIEAFQSKIAAYEKRIKELQQQRDGAIEQMTQLEDEISQARLEKVEATKARKDREEDLKVVLDHYHTLQKDHEALQTKAEELEKTIVATAKISNTTASTDRAALLEEQADELVSEAFESDTVTREEEKEQEMEQDDDSFGDTDIVSQAPHEDFMRVEAGSPTPMNEPHTEPEANCQADCEVNRRADPRTDAQANSQADGGAKHPITSEIMKSASDLDVGTEGLAVPVKDDDTVTRLLREMEDLKTRKEERLTEETNKDARRDMSTDSNGPEDMSIDNVVECAEQGGSVLCDDVERTNWKDIKIAKLMSELEQAKSAVWALEEKEKSAQAQVEMTERKLLVAQGEAEEAKKRQNAREGNLRDTIAHQKRLENEYKQVQEKVASLEEQLEQATKEARIREEETKAARKRAAGYHAQFKRLQEKHDEAMKVIQDQERQIEMLEKGRP